MISIIYLTTINNPEKIDIKIIQFFDSKVISINSVAMIEIIKDTKIGDVMIFKPWFLDHFESTEKNKNAIAIIVIGINIAL